MKNNKDYVERFIKQDQNANKRLKPLNNTPLMLGSICQ
jgi:hypothetical protein